MPGQERLVRLNLVADVVDLEDFQPVGGVLEAGEQRVELADCDVGNAGAHS